MKFAIVGAGAMGCLYGAHLARAGNDVTLIDIRPDVVHAINRDGVRVDGVGGDFHANVAACAPEHAQELADVVSIHADTRGTVAAADLARRIIAQDGYAITFQNGIGNVEALVEALSPERVLGGVSYNSASGSGPGRVTHTVARTTWVGELQHGETRRVNLLRDAFVQADLETSVSDNITGVIWNKFVAACAVNPVAALTGMIGSQFSRDPSADALQDRILDELLAVVRAKGVRLADEDPAGSIKRMCRNATEKPSMLQHVEAGRLTEIDSHNGAVVRLGQALGVPTPYNEAVTLMVKARSARMIGDLKV